MMIHIKTERLILREILPEDLEGMFELDSDPEVHRYLGNKTVTTRDDSAEIIRSIRKQYEENGIGRWAVIHKSSGEFMGWSGLKLEKELRNNHSGYYDLGYRFLPKYWGFGYGYESAIVSLNYGFRTLNLPVIYASAHVDNLASNKIILKCGFRFVETYPYHDHIVNWYEAKNGNKY